MNTSTIKNETVIILKELRQNIVDLEKQHNKMLNTYREKEAIQLN